jgi:hypothetical protein
MALGQLSGNQNPDLKLLLNTITIAQNASQISLAINIPGDLIKKLGRTKGMPIGPTSSFAVSSQR